MHNREMPKMAPRSGFDWRRVKWSRYASDHCSYCGDALDEDAVPLRLFLTKSELGAVFCDHCMAAWWGIQTYDDPVTPRHEPEVLRSKRTDPG